ncbi:hypothetical protein QWY99_22140 [Flavobacterium branchiarum]|uniref:Uncharacterized protein n=1 Tax=Flavobacterium branchiarum TaxID=1114870 RepID=A0ABV5FTS0_9FLAO|nr:hypothetical protein [Flavobacterium branchiarum]MDN3671505.1 hypothetical protein [Flavobacterium branchiarum]MDN3672618.1 hypothetical protein [Flavobacterium branchiarum]MDN3675738.1 hypothetical protein [Flavobacterium branchiarum]
MSNEKAVDYFDRHPSSNECHITSDNRVFHTKGTADSHANGLKDNKVNSHYRSDYELSNIEVLGPDIETGIATETPEEKEAKLKLRVDKLVSLGFQQIEDNFVNAETNSSISATDVFESTDELFEISITPPKTQLKKVYTIEDLKVFDFESDYEVIKAIVKGLALESASNSKKDLLEAITKAKANLESQE